MRREGLRAAAVAVIALAGLLVAPSPASAAMDVQKYIVTSPSNGDDIKTVTALCPPGKKVVGGGS